MDDGWMDKITLKEWLKGQIESEVGWFIRQELAPDLMTPGWSDPKREKLPHFGLPEDMRGLRVLDVGCSEGFFSFEAQRRGAKEVVAIDSSPLALRRFNLCRIALNSNVTAHLTNVYDLNVRAFGTFDLVFFFGVLYHLRNPILALEKIFSVCTGTLLFQSHSFDDPAVGDKAMAEFYPFGIESGPPENRSWDPATFWVPNAACIRDMLAHVGFKDIERRPPLAGEIFRARVPEPTKAVAPDYYKAPWS
jgi:tRNA (mo5U34)-methyltransferase